ncbi:TolC family protein, partial [Acinetobacter baumannii]
MKKLIMLSVILGLSQRIVQAQSNIDQYIAIGLANNQSIQQQHFELSKAEYALQQAKTFYYPNIAFNSTYTLAQGGRV